MIQGTDCADCAWTGGHRLRARRGSSRSRRPSPSRFRPSTASAIAILAEAALSYLGLGTQPPQPSWGRMLSEAQTLMFEAPLLAIWPGLAIALAVLGLNLLGDGLRDLLDPRLARSR